MGEREGRERRREEQDRVDARPAERSHEVQERPPARVAADLGPDRERAREPLAEEQLTLLEDDPRGDHEHRPDEVPEEGEDEDDAEQHRFGEPSRPKFEGEETRRTGLDGEAGEEDRAFVAHSVDDRGDEERRGVDPVFDEQYGAGDEEVSRESVREEEHGDGVDCVAGPRERSRRLEEQETTIAEERLPTPTAVLERPDRSAVRRRRGETRGQRRRIGTGALAHGGAAEGGRPIRNRQTGSPATTRWLTATSARKRRWKRRRSTSQASP